MDIINHLLLLCALTIPSSRGSDAAEVRKGEDNKYVCGTAVCKQRANLIKEYLDKSDRPCEDFYSYTCKQWAEKHQDKNSYDGFLMMQATFIKAMEEILNTTFAPESAQKVTQKPSVVYKACMGVTEGEEKSEDVVEIIKALNFTSWPLSTVGITQENHYTSYKTVLSTVGISPLVNIVVGRGDYNVHKNVIKIFSLMFRMAGSKDRIVSALKFITNLEQSQIDAIATSIIKFENKLALAMATARRSPPTETSVRDLKTTSSGFPLFDVLKKEFTKADVEIQDDDIVEIYHPGLYLKLVDIIQEDSPTTLYNYLGLQAVLSWAEYASTSFTTQLGGTTPTRSEQCVSLVSSAMKEVTAHLYARKYVPLEAKHEIEVIVRGVRDVFLEAIKTASWLDAETAAKAERKLTKMVSKVGYPNWLLNVAELNELYKDVNHLCPATSFVNMMYTVALNNEKRHLEKLRHTYDHDRDWFFRMSKVTAYYKPSGNEIVLPAGGLQFPFYEYGLPLSLNFGGVGAVIAHEITHSLTGLGSIYDEDGRIQPWWSNKTRTSFFAHSTCFLNQYGSAYGEEAKQKFGAMRLDENIADTVGLRVAFKAYTNLLEKQCKGTPPAQLEGLRGFSGRKLFFIAYAMAWCSVSSTDNINTQESKRQHSLNQYRVNIPTSNLPAFSEEFQCAVDSSQNMRDKTACSLLPLTFEKPQ